MGLTSKGREKGEGKTEGKGKEGRAWLAHKYFGLEPRCRSSQLTVPTCDNRPLVYDGDRQALSTARFRLLATADTCFI